MRRWDRLHEELLEVFPGTFARAQVRLDVDVNDKALLERPLEGFDRLGCVARVYSRQHDRRSRCAWGIKVCGELGRRAVF